MSYWTSRGVRHGKQLASKEADLDYVHDQPYEEIGRAVGIDGALAQAFVANGAHVDADDYRLTTLNFHHQMNAIAAVTSVARVTRMTILVRRRETIA